MHIKRVLQAIHSAYEVELDGTWGVPDGFRLRRLRDWTVPNQDTPLTLSSHLGRVCKIHCEFCYIDGNPPTLAMAKGGRVVSESELEARLSLYDRRGGVELFQSHYQLKEVLDHPRAIHYLQKIRAITPRVLSLTTAGASLTRAVVAQLAELRPIRLWISLNVIDEDLRRTRLMDRRPGRAVAALELLREFEIPYCVSIVPLDGALEATEATLRFADQFAPGFIRVILPGFTDYDRQAQWHERWEEAWHDAVRMVRRVRPTLATPIIVYPQIFEEVHYDELNRVTVLGAIVGSPAAQAGLRWGDRIKRIDGDEVESRSDTVDRLAASSRARVRVELEIERGSGDVSISLNPHRGHAYPFATEHVDYHVQTSPFGVVIGGGLRPSSFDRLEDLAARKGVGEIWFASSPLMLPLVGDMIDRLAFPRRVDCRFRFLPVRCHSMGGNVVVGEMMSLRDIYHAIHKEMREQGGKPDLVVVPRTLLMISNGWMRDLEGVFVSDLQRALSIPIEVFDCDEIKF